MEATTFDALGYFEKLKAAGVPEEQAKVQASALRAIADERAMSREYLDARFKESEARLQKEIKDAEMRLLKWQWGIALVLAAIMARGFGWLGF